MHAAVDHTVFYPGVIFNSGTAIWLGTHWGLTAELDYSIMAHHGVTYEMEIAMGLAYRFP